MRFFTRLSNKSPCRNSCPVPIQCRRPSCGISPPPNQDYRKHSQMMELDVQFTDSRRLKSFPVIHLEPGTAVQFISQPKTGRQRRTETVMMLKTQRRRNEKPVICLPQIGNIHRHMICGVGFPLLERPAALSARRVPS